jgi:hypothetical protein
MPGLNACALLEKRRNDGGPSIDAAARYRTTRRDSSLALCVTLRRVARAKVSGRVAEPESAETKTPIRSLGH